MSTISVVHTTIDSPVGIIAPSSSVPGRLF
jgi:hypothetical protein